MARTIPKISAVVVFLPLLATMWCGCTGNILQHQYHHITQEGWLRSDTLSFNIPEPEENGFYKVRFEMRTAPTFKYSQLWIAYDFRTNIPYRLVSDTICFTTGTSGDNKLGGKGVTHRNFTTESVEIFLHQGQRGDLIVRHIMAEEPISEITEIGVKVYRCKE
ncbi:MAG: hypothetical protein IKU79_03865 [Bacteroidaceae bacterium]|nr:hypothetical protein [Bacteroidaceae bacterium]